MPVKVSRAGYLSYYYSRRRKRADTSLDPGLVPEGNWTALSAALLSDQTQGGFRIQTAVDDAFGMSQKSRTDFVVGATYRIRATVDIVSSSTTATLRVGTATINNAGSLIDAAKTADGSWELTFVASATTLYFGVAVSRAAFSADATVSDFSIDWQPIDLDELSLNDLSATADEEWSATITGKTTGSTIEATASDGTVLTVVGTTVSGTFTAAGAKTVSLEETHPNARAPRTTHIGVTVDVGSETPVIEIDAPTNVTYVDDTNPPLFSMNYSDTGPGAVLVGDVLQKRYASAPGTVYDSDPITEIPVLQPVEFSDPVQADGTIDEGQLRWSRTGGIYSEWSNVAEPGSGAYEIISVGAPEAFTPEMWGVADLVTSGDIRYTITDMPSDNGSPITDIEYRIGAGSWLSSGLSAPGTFDHSGLTDDVEVITDVRAVNAEGNGPDSDDKTVTPTAPASYETESEAIFAAFTTPPDNAHKAAINFFVLALKAASIWNKFDFLYGLAAADSQAARINWVNPGTYNATVVGSPTFTADRGYVGASGAYLSSGFNPTTAPSPKFTQNDASMFIWALDGGTATGAISGEIGATNSRIGKDFGAGDSIARPNMSSSIQPMTTTGFPGSVGWTRSASNVWEAYANGVDAGGGTGASAAPSNEVFRVCNSIAANGQLQDAFAMAGSNLTSGEVAALHDAMNDYLVAVGAI
jgi:hypothetical protein